MARTAQLASSYLDSETNAENGSTDLALQCYRLWAVYSNLQPTHSISRHSAIPEFLPTAQIWRSYHGLLSELLQRRAFYPKSADRAARLEQAAEFRRTQATYEGFLLKDTSFPKATEDNLEVELWVEQVIQNWEVLCGPDWNDADLGEGGQNAFGRNVLDVLYRAATKTFHSTLILRRLFEVHKSLTDFELAFKALDTYLEIVKRTKARLRRSSDAPSGMEDDNIILLTVSDGIESLCCFGALAEAEKAIDLINMVEPWLEQVKTDMPHHPGMNGDSPTLIRSTARVKIEPQTLAKVYRAIGIGRANWARWTAVNESRDELQAQALRDLKRAVLPSYGRSNDIASNFALGLLLAEMRDLNGAIEQVKNTLAEPTSISGIYLVTERSLLPLWHLLALLLSARQDFDTSSRSCEAAFEQFSSPTVLFGQPSTSSIMDSPSVKVEHLPAATTFHQEKGLVDAMEGREKERIIEIRITQLALTEVLEGPEVAVNTSDELLSLFLRLFGHLDIGMEEKPKTKETVPPKSSAATVKSFRGSIFGRRKAGRSSLRDTAMSTTTIQENAINQNSSTSDGAPEIQVTNPDEKTADVRPMSLDISRNGRHLEASTRDSRPQHKLQRREGSINKIIRERSTSRPASSYVPSQRQSVETGREVISRNRSVSHPPVHTSDGSMPSPSQVGIATSPDIPDPAGSPVRSHNDATQGKQPLPPIRYDLDQTKAPPPVSRKTQPPAQDVRLPNLNPRTRSTQPRPRFPYVQAQKHALSLLIKTWLVIAGLYRRAAMFEDAREACEEAARHATRVETLIGTLESSAKALNDAGWGAGKSSDELWADVYAERGFLCIAQSQPHDAMEHLEHALLSFPYHAGATVGLANILLDIYDQITPPERPRPALNPGIIGSATVNQAKSAAEVRTSLQNGFALKPVSKADMQTSEELRKTPENLNRLAARDRAYGLLSTLTKLGNGWDNSQAWFALARAYEAGGQIEKAKEVLWWCVELEDRRPVRHWWSVGSGGYVV